SAAATTVTSTHQPIAVVDCDTRCLVAWAISSRPVSITAIGASGVKIDLCSALVRFCSSGSNADRYVGCSAACDTATSAETPALAGMNRIRAAHEETAPLGSRAAPPQPRS